jgi:hypothetical protein
VTSRTWPALVLATALLVAGCADQSASPPASAAPSVGAPAASPGVTQSAPPTGAPTPPPSAGPSQTAAATTCTLPSGAVAPTLDPSLMSVLPSTVGGIAVAQEPNSFGEAVADPCFVANVDRAVFPIAVSGNDLASGVVAHLRPGVYSDAFFADWRATYDQGACAQASGVAGEADQSLGGRTIYVTTCGGGLRVYHAYLASMGVIVSLLSTGPAGLGEQLMGQLQG